MCGIVAALPAYQSLASEDAASVLPVLPGPPLSAAQLLRQPAAAEKALRDLLGEVEAALQALSTETAGVELLRNGPARQELATACSALMDWAAELDRLLDTPGSLGWDAGRAWRRSRACSASSPTGSTAYYAAGVEVAESARALHPGQATARCALSYLAVETVLQTVNRLEVRGRDSAGVSIWVQLDGADRATLAGSLTGRADPRLRNGSVVVTAHGACFVYKHAAIVGKLGDNGAALRRALRDDADLHALLALPSAAVTVLAHTRWASVGRISEANAHPVNGPPSAPMTPAISIAVLNGDIDNYGALSKQITYEPDERGITTDAKVIPVLLSQRLAEGADAGSALCACLADFAGFMAIAAQAETSDEVLLAVKGSGQSVYVGLGFGGFVVASEVYGLVATTSRYLRVEGAAWPEATRQGTVLALARRGSGTLAAIRRWDGDGAPRPVEPSEVRTAEVTTRDLALDSAVHYLYKEVHEAPSSFRKTLRGRVRQHPASPAVSLPPSSLPPEVRERISSGQIRQIVVVGQGTAAVAAQGVARFVRPPSVTG